MRELRATDLPAGTTADVEVMGDGTFFVRVYYGMATGESRGTKTITEGVTRAITNATGREVTLDDQPDTDKEPIMSFPEPFGPIYESPEPAACPGCPCCTRRLCEAGKLSMLGCLGRTSATDPEARNAIAECPCDQAPDSARSVLAARLEGVTDTDARKRIVAEIADSFVYRDRLRHANGGVYGRGAEAVADQHRTGDLR